MTIHKIDSVSIHGMTWDKTKVTDFKEVECGEQEVMTVRELLSHLRNRREYLISINGIKGEGKELTLVTELIGAYTLINALAVRYADLDAKMTCDIKEA